MTPSAWRDGGRGETIRYVDRRQPARPDAGRGDGQGHLPADLRRGRSARCSAASPMRPSVPDDGTIAALGRGRARRRSSIRRRRPTCRSTSRGTAFQEAVWQELRKIPLGETRSYADIAAAVGQPEAVRAVGTANGSNPVAVLVPCHRVIRSRRHARRLCRRPRPQAQAARGRGRRSAADLAASERLSSSLCRLLLVLLEHGSAPLPSPLVILSMISRLRALRLARMRVVGDRREQRLCIRGVACRAEAAERP